MPKTIISDTSCFILPTNIDKLELLHKVSGQIITTPEIAAEYGEPLPEWVKIVTVMDKYRQQLLKIQIDKGESSAIALALETPDSTIIMDDIKARKIAVRLHLSFTSTLSVIIKKLQGIIPNIKPLLIKMKQTTFRLS